MLKKSLILMLVSMLIVTQSSCMGSSWSEVVDEDDDSLYWWCPNRYNHVSNMGDAEVYRNLIQKTNTNLKFLHPQTGEYRERFLVMLENEILPDIISHDFLSDYPGGPSGALEDGVILPLNDIIEAYCPNIQAYLEAHPDIKKLISTDDGDIFCFPSIQEEPEIRTYIGPFIREDRIETLGLEPPETIDEWYHVLLALKNQYGDYPLTFYGGKIIDTDFLIGAYDLSWGFYLDEETVKCGVMEPEFNLFISELKRWYDEGLINPGVFTDSQKTYISKSKKAKASVFVDYISSMEVYQNAFEKKDSSATLLPLKYPVRLKGEEAFSGHRTNVFIPYASAYISKDNKDLEATAKMFDYMYSQEGQVLMNFGIEGVSYQMINNEPIYLDVMFDHEAGFSNAVKEYTAAGPYVRMKSQFQQMLVMDIQKEASKLWRMTEADQHALPQITLPIEEAKNCGFVEDTMDDVILNWVKDYVLDDTGSVSVEQLQRNLRSMGVDEVIDCYQKVVDDR